MQPELQFEILVALAGEHWACRPCYYYRNMFYNSFISVNNHLILISDMPPKKKSRLNLIDDSSTTTAVPGNILCNETGTNTASYTETILRTLLPSVIDKSKQITKLIASNTTLAPQRIQTQEPLPGPSYEQHGVRVGHFVTYSESSGESTDEEEVHYISTTKDSTGTVI